VRQRHFSWRHSASNAQGSSAFRPRFLGNSRVFWAAPGQNLESPHEAASTALRSVLYLRFALIVYEILFLKQPLNCVCFKISSLLLAEAVNFPSLCAEESFLNQQTNLKCTGNDERSAISACEFSQGKKSPQKFIECNNSKCTFFNFQKISP
jgi:hypothetical protein